MLSYDFKPAKVILCFAPTHLFLLDKMFQAGFPNPLPKCVHLIFVAFCHQLYPAIGQIAHRPSHFEFVGDFPDAIAEADALDPARIEHLHSFALHSTIPRDNVPQSDWTREENSPLRHFLTIMIKQYPASVRK